MPTNSIRLEVDGKSFRAWSKAFLQLQRRYQVPIEPHGNVADLPTIPANTTFTGLRLLLEVGLSCTRPHVLNDPARQFALLRYATSIANKSTFALGDHVLNTDSHKKMVLSDEFGCGFSFLLSRSFLSVQSFLDVETALAKRMIRLELPKSRRPDFVGIRENKTLALIEAKGTQSSHSYSKTQVKSGCDQLAKVKAKAAAITARIAIGTSIVFAKHKKQTTLFVSDPPEDADAKELVFNGPAEEIVNRSHFARVGAWVGDSGLVEEGATDLKPKLVTKIQRGVRREGSALSVTDGQSSFEIFVGLDSEIREAIRSKDHERITALKRSDRTQLSMVTLSDITDKKPIDAPDGGHKHAPVAEVESDDGASLTFELSGPLSKELLEQADSESALT